MLQTLLDGSQTCQCCLRGLESLGSPVGDFTDTTCPVVSISSSPPQSHLDCCGFDNSTRYFVQESSDECNEGHPRCNVTEEDLSVVRGYLRNSIQEVATSLFLPPQTQVCEQCSLVSYCFSLLPLPSSLPSSSPSSSPPSPIQSCCDADNQNYTVLPVGNNTNQCIHEMICPHCRPCYNFWDKAVSRAVLLAGSFGLIFSFTQVTDSWEEEGRREGGGGEEGEEEEENHYVVKIQLQQFVEVVFSAIHTFTMYTVTQMCILLW